MSVPGYQEFEFDLPGALLKRLVEIFDGMSPVMLSAASLAIIPEEQGVYELFLDTGGVKKLVYIGKTDAEAGLLKRLTRHAKKIQNRSGLNPATVHFKAVRVFVFTAVDLETDLIKEAGGTKKVSWNGSGFGSNDVGIERDTTKYKADHFDTLYPIDSTLSLGFPLPTTATAADILKILKAKLPYTLRFESIAPKSRQPHADLPATAVTLDPKKHNTPETVLRAVVSQLPKGWHVTKLPSHIIMYKNDKRSFPNGKLIGKSPGTP